MSRGRRQSGSPQVCTETVFTVPNGAGPSTILLDLISPCDGARVISAVVTVKTAGVGGATASLSLKSGSTVLASLIALGANTQAAGTYIATADGDQGKTVSEGAQLSVLWTLLAGTNTTGAVYIIAINWGL